MVVCTQFAGRSRGLRTYSGMQRLERGLVSSHEVASSSCLERRAGTDAVWGFFVKLFFEASPGFGDDAVDGQDARHQQDQDDLEALLREDSSGASLRAPAVTSLFAGLRGDIDVDWGPWPDSEAPPTVPDVVYRPRTLAAS